MRLINTTTLQMKVFESASIPRYAILSHTWQDGEEVSLQEFDYGSKIDSTGYQKISDCCSLALSHGLEWAWIDTCCIDKTSSTEVSEAINSMFQWYQRSTVCFVFLQDLGVLEADSNGSRWIFEESLKDCRWFKRGWTLQELLASDNILFFDRGLHQIGTKVTLKHRLAKITNIDIKYLDAPTAFRQASVAQRMSWASGRETTRVEDSAYCLMGLFDVNMPLIYGEGRRAFTRLQLEIMSRTDDDSIFAWLSDLDGYKQPHGLLAKSVADFRGCQNLVCTTTVDQRAPSIIGNREIHLPYTAPNWGHLFSRKHFGHVEEYLTLPLRCVSSSGHGRLLLHLVMAQGEHGNNTGSLYYRRRSSYQPYTGGIRDTALTMCSMTLFPQAPCRIGQDTSDDTSPAIKFEFVHGLRTTIFAARFWSYVAVLLSSAVLIICSLVYPTNAPFVWACATVAWTLADQSRFLLLAYLVAAAIRSIFL